MDPHTRVLRVCVLCISRNGAQVSKPRQLSKRYTHKQRKKLLACVPGLCIHNEHKRACKVRKALISLALATT
jgi:hypothetical protein